MIARIVLYAKALAALVVLVLFLGLMFPPLGWLIWLALGACFGDGNALSQSQCDLLGGSTC